MVDEKNIYNDSVSKRDETTLRNTPIISMRGVGVKYDNNPEILSDVDLDINPGSFHFLTGASGAGKTTLLSLMYMANQPVRGRLSLFGHSVENMNRDQMALMKRKMGVIFQDYRLLDNLTVFDNVVLPLMIAGKSQKYIDKYVPDLLQWIGLGKYIYERPTVLSGGQKQRVAIARAVITKPDLIIADEPT
ncbi:MAG: ATP-binding cassette domain-containing protein, partial [Rickettsiales bacterium]|nr:ATP-binding cassette domain-containing protein [Rickettsiales bacterium]